MLRKLRLFSFKTPARQSLSFTTICLLLAMVSMLAIQIVEFTIACQLRQFPLITNNCRILVNVLTFRSLKLLKRLLSIAALTREGFSDTSCDNDVLKNCRARYLQLFTLRSRGDTLNSLLCIYLKHLHEVQRLTPTGLRDIHNWIKDERII